MALNELKASASNETKSSAGDKFETARAMIHIEQDNIRRQLAETVLQKEILDRIDPNQCSPDIRIGSVVNTSKGWFFMSTALGKIVIADKTVTAISPQSPLGKQLLGLKAGDQIRMNNLLFEIEAIY